jgi:hypothetical protein
MRRVLCVALWCLSASAMADTISFDADVVGQAPARWTCGATGRGAPQWTVESDPGAQGGKVLRQSGSATFPWCVRTHTALTDGWVETKFKPISGKEDQAGGVIWRAKDADNYYIARANALEDNVCIYHTINGKRTEKKRVQRKVASNEWHILRVEFQGGHFKVTFDGKPALEWDDETFTEAGMVGVWTKADSVTLFDDFTYGSK